MIHMNTVICPRCGQPVNVGIAEQPPRYVTREATDRDPRTFLIVGREPQTGNAWLLHRCVIK